MSGTLEQKKKALEIARKVLSGPFVQILNPVTNRWEKISRKTGRIVARKKTPGPYKRIRKVNKVKIGAQVTGR